MIESETTSGGSVVNEKDPFSAYKFTVVNRGNWRENKWPVKV